MAPMYFEWDENKNRQNLLKHDVRFETAALVFDDPHALTQRDQSSENEERWITLGAVGAGAVLFVVHTWREEWRGSDPRYFGTNRDATRKEKI